MSNFNTEGVTDGAVADRVPKTDESIADGNSLDLATDRRYLLILGVLLCGVTLAVDARLQLGIASAVPYAGVIWLACASRSRRSVWMAAIACSLLTLLGMLASPGVIGWEVFANRGLALVAIWVTALPCLQVLRLMREADERSESVERNRAEISRQREEDLRKSGMLAGMMADLTGERTKLRDEMTRSKQLAAIVESSEDGIISTTFDGTVISWNRGAEKLYGYRAEEMIGQRAHRLLPDDRLDEIAGIMGRIRHEERVEAFETIRVAKDGTHRDISLTVAIVRDAEGRPIGGCSIARDISQLKHVVAALREVNYDLERRVKRRTTQLARTNESLLSSNVELQRFAYVASHDLQAPLRTIAAYAGFLEEDYADRLGETAREHIAHIVSSATRMQTLVRDLLELSRVESRIGQYAPVSLDDAFRRALEMLGGAIEDSDAQVACEELPMVRADPTQMAQLFQNLIGNAIKYHGDEAPRVTVTAESKGNDWHIFVGDNGIGVPEEQHKKVFDVFTRLKTEASYPGTGLGLAICRRIVNRHGGRIWVESEEGNGSTFCFAIPKSPPKVPPR